jgi:tripartite-type tricarboxylate transporter receptor subunit TctC
MNALLRDAEVRDTLLKQGLTPRLGTPDELARTINVDLERWTRLIRTANIKPD